MTLTLTLTLTLDGDACADDFRNGDDDCEGGEGDGEASTVAAHGSAAEVTTLEVVHAILQFPRFYAFFLACTPHALLTEILEVVHANLEVVQAYYKVSESVSRGFKICSKYSI